MSVRTEYLLAAGAAGVCLSGSVCSATLIELTAEGTVTTVEGALPAPLGGVAAGDGWEMRVVYETDTSPFSMTSTTAEYFPVSAIEVVVDGTDATPAGAAAGTLAGVLNNFDSSDPAMDRDEFFFAFAEDPVDATLQMRDFDQTALDSTALPESLEFSEFDESVFVVRSGDPEDDSRIEGGVDSVSLRIIPAPSGLAVLGFAGASCAGAATAPSPRFVLTGRRLSETQ